MKLVTALIIRQGKLLVIRKAGEQEFDLPGIEIKEHQNIEECLRRLLEESFGLRDVKIWEFLKNRRYRSQGVDMLCDLCIVEASGNVQSSEGIEEIKWMSREEKLDRDRGYELRDFLDFDICPYLIETGKWGKINMGWYDSMWHQ